MHALTAPTEANHISTQRQSAQHEVVTDAACVLDDDEVVTIELILPDLPVQVLIFAIEREQTRNDLGVLDHLRPFLERTLRLPCVSRLSGG